MREPLFTPGNEMLLEHGPTSDPTIQERAALHRAIGMAIESAFTYGKDLPVGAVILERGPSIIGRGYANDSRFGYHHLHAEQMALNDVHFDVMGGKPDRVVVSLEPCGDCQDMLAKVPSLRKVSFGISRAEVADMGLVNPKGEDIFDRVNRYGHTYQVEQIEDEELHEAGLTVLRHVSRNPATGEVSVDTVALNEALEALNEG